MARKKIWKDEVELTSRLMIDITTPKAYVLANTPYNENHWTRVFETLSNEIVVARATQVLPLSREVQITIESQNSIDNIEYETILRKMRYELGLDESMKVFRQLKDEDSLIDIALQSNPGFRLFANSEAIETAVLTILSQNTSFFSYLDIVEKFLLKHGTLVPWDKSLYLFPSRSKLSEMNERDWLDLKVGYKAKYLSKLNEEVLHEIETYAYYPIIERGLEGLRSISGIGNYTARILTIYHSRRYDYPFYDTYVLEVLDHKYEIGNINNQKQFDNWVFNKWPKDPALVIHSLLLEYLPELLRSHETFYTKLGKTTNQPTKKSVKKLKNAETEKELPQKNKLEKEKTTVKRKTTTKKQTSTRKKKISKKKTTKGKKKK